MAEDPAHLEELAREKRRAHEGARPRPPPGSCTSADAFTEVPALRGEHLGGQVSRLLKPLDRDDMVELEAALARKLGGVFLARRVSASARAIGHETRQRRVPSSPFRSPPAPSTSVYAARSRAPAAGDRRERTRSAVEQLGGYDG